MARYCMFIMIVWCILWACHQMLPWVIYILLTIILFINLVINSTWSVKEKGCSLFSIHWWTCIPWNNVLVLIKRHFVYLFQKGDVRVDWRSFKKRSLWWSDGDSLEYNVECYRFVMLCYVNVFLFKIPQWNVVTSTLPTYQLSLMKLR